MAEVGTYEPGYTRPGLPMLWGWAEFLRASERTDNALRYLRDSAPDFPVPAATVEQGPLFIRAECEAFLIDHPRQDRPALTDGEIQRLVAMLGQGIPVRQIADQLAVSPQTVYRYRARRSA